MASPLTDKYDVNYCLSGFGYPVEFDSSLCRSQSGNGYPERRATHIVETDLIKESDGSRVAAVFAANTQV